MRYPAFTVILCLIAAVTSAQKKIGLEINLAGGVGIARSTAIIPAGARPADLIGSPDLNGSVRSIHFSPLITYKKFKAGPAVGFQDYSMEDPGAWFTALNSIFTYGFVVQYEVIKTKTGFSIAPAIETGLFSITNDKSYRSIEFENEYYAAFGLIFGLKLTDRFQLIATPGVNYQSADYNYSGGNQTMDVRAHALNIELGINYNVF